MQTARKKKTEKKPAARGQKGAPRDFSFLEPGRVYSVTDFCELSNTPRSTLNTWRRRDGFPVRDVGGGGVIRADDVLDWIANRPLRSGVSTS